MGKIRDQYIYRSNGITLVELLVSLALISLIVTLGITIYLISTKQYDSQNIKMNEQHNITLAMKDITKEIRSSSTLLVSGNTVITETSQCGGNILSENHEKVVGDSLITDSHEYQFIGNQLLKDGNIILKNMKHVEFSQTDAFISEEATSTGKTESCPLVTINLESFDEKFSLYTEIFIRK